jgi:hypothetical protein
VKYKKEYERLKKRVDKLESIISWLTDGDNDNMEAMYDNIMSEHEEEERKFFESTALS